MVNVHLSVKNFNSPRTSLPAQTIAIPFILSDAGDFFISHDHLSIVVRCVLVPEPRHPQQPRRYFVSLWENDESYVTRCLRQLGEFEEGATLSVVKDRTGDGQPDLIFGNTDHLLEISAATALEGTLATYTVEWVDRSLLWLTDSDDIREGQYLYDQAYAYEQRFCPEVVYDYLFKIIAETQFTLEQKISARDRLIALHQANFALDAYLEFVQNISNDPAIIEDSSSRSLATEEVSAARSVDPNGEIPLLLYALGTKQVLSDNSWRVSLWTADTLADMGHLELAVSIAKKVMDRSVYVGVDQTSFSMAFRCILEYGGANEAKTTLHAFSRKNTSALGKTITDELTATLSESLWTANQ